jgi:hypothetical protein
MATTASLPTLYPLGPVQRAARVQCLVYWIPHLATSGKCRTKSPNLVNCRCRALSRSVSNEVRPRQSGFHVAILSVKTINFPNQGLVVTSTAHTLSHQRHYHSENTSNITTTAPWFAVFSFPI